MTRKELFFEGLRQGYHMSASVPFSIYWSDDGINVKLYNTIIAVVTNDEIGLRHGGHITRTTSRYIGYILDYYGLSQLGPRVTKGLMYVDNRLVGNDSWLFIKRP